MDRQNYWQNKKGRLLVFRFQDKQRIRRRLQGFTDKDATATMAKNIKDIMAGVMNDGLQKYITSILSDKTREALIQWQIIPASFERYATDLRTPLSQHLEDFKRR